MSPNNNADLALIVAFSIGLATGVVLRVVPQLISALNLDATAVTIMFISWLTFKFMSNKFLTTSQASAVRTLRAIAADGADAHVNLENHVHLRGPQRENRGEGGVQGALQEHADLDAREERYWQTRLLM